MCAWTAAASCPEDKGRIVTAFLSSFFKRYVEYDFTADLEEKLDEVSAGELSWKQLLRDFWTSFHAAAEETKSLKFADVITALDEILGPHMFPERADGGDPRICPTCGNGRLNLKLGKFGAFIGCSNYPECRYTRQMGRGDENGGAEARALGIDPKSGLEVALKSGRFGPYVQLGNGEKPQRSSIPKGFSLETMDLEKALRLLSLPREVGLHPETGKPIMAGFGRFGPYLSHDGAYASLETPEDVFTVGLNHAVTLLAERKAKGGRGPRGGQALKELGAHPGRRCAHQGDERALWTLCHRRLGECDSAEGFRSDVRDARRSGRAACRACGKGTREEKGPGCEESFKRREESTGEET